MECIKYSRINGLFTFVVISPNNKEYSYMDISKEKILRMAITIIKKVNNKIKLKDSDIKIKYLLDYYGIYYFNNFYYYLIDPSK